MGTGVGEAMLIGAAVGGGSSALMGGDPIKGAMLGAAGGGLGAGLGAAAGASGAAALLLQRLLACLPARRLRPAACPPPLFACIRLLRDRILPHSIPFQDALFVFC